MYEVDGDLLMVASDRISAYDVVLPDPDPRQGRGADADVGVLVRAPRRRRAPTTTSPRTCPRRPPGRAMRVRRLEMYPVECVVRGYLSGSGWREYRETGAVCGIELPEGLQRVGQAARADLHAGDQGRARRARREHRLRARRARSSATGRSWSSSATATIELYKHARDHAAERGIIIADTKFEFGSHPGAEVVLGDEVLTPDSSRFWPADAYEPGRSQRLVRQAVRARLARPVRLGPLAAGAGAARRGDRQHAGKYVEAYERISGRELSPARARLAMNIFIWGMRRSGTTILYDALLEDPGLRCFYEPLREQAETDGGGSGAREGDAFAETRELRERFRASTTRSSRSSTSTGAARGRRRSSSSPSLPDHVPRAAARAARAAPDVAIKETRLYHKLARRRRARPGRGRRAPGPRPARGDRLDACSAADGGTDELPDAERVLHRAHRAASCGRAARSPRSWSPAEGRSTAGETSPTSCASCWSGRSAFETRLRRRAPAVRRPLPAAPKRGPAADPAASSSGSTRRPAGRSPAGGRWAAANIRRDSEIHLATTPLGAAARRSGWSALRRAGYAEILELEPAGASRSTSASAGSRAARFMEPSAPALAPCRRPCEPRLTLLTGEGARADPAEGGHPRPPGQGGRAGAAGARLRGHLATSASAAWSSSRPTTAPTSSGSASSCSPTR